MSPVLVPLSAPRHADGFATLVRHSHRRSRSLLPSPGMAAPKRVWSETQTRQHLAAHPLGSHVPLLYRLLVPAAQHNGLALAVADAQGRILDLTGAPDATRLAADAGLVPGTCWSESTIGTNGIGTAVACGRPVRIAKDEHYAPPAHALTCWAVPVRYPSTGKTAAVINLSAWPSSTQSGGDYELALLLAAAYAVELRLSDHDAERSHTAELRVLGRTEAMLGTDLGHTALSARHSEIALLLAWHAGGLTAQRLATLLYERREDPALVRAEVRRLRQALDDVAGGDLSSRPYAFVRAPHLDASRVLTMLDGGDVGGAIGAYRGLVLPESSAPGVVAIRREVHTRLRRAVLNQDGADLTLAFAQVQGNEDDAALWWQCLRQLPPDSAAMARVAAQVERIDADFAF